MRRGDSSPLKIVFIGICSFRRGRIENDKTVASEESIIVFEELHVCDEVGGGRNNVRGEKTPL